MRIATRTAIFTTLPIMLAALAFVTTTCTTAAALCGDVTGDSKVTTADALGVLRKAVGQDAPLTCEAPTVELLNYMGFANTLACNSSSVKAQMTWSRHPGQTWNDNSQSSLPLNIVYKRVDDPEVSGTITLTFGACGSIAFDIDSWGVLFPMPSYGGAWVFPYFEPADGLVYLFLELAAVEAAAIRYGEPATMLTAIAAAPAPPGLSNTVEP
ncbi:MAG: hypothetical protein ABR538_07455 [Candidatus Binatia bacterium]